MIRCPADRQFDLPAGAVRLYGPVDDRIRLVSEGLLKAVPMRELADVFRYRSDRFATGEFFGKFLRAICLAAGYTGDPALGRIADEAARDILSIQRADGCLSACPDDTQPKGTYGSDLWERKYVLEGLLAYFEFRGSREALDGAAALVRYTNRQVGDPPRTPVTETGWAFAGMESASILEPVMRVYRLTGDLSAGELGRYLVGSGCCGREDVFEAIRRGRSPWEIGGNGRASESVAKAYEMTSCFEGLCEYARATGDEEALRTAVLYARRVAEEEITLIGSGGADGPFNLGPGTGEQWNRVRFEQTKPDIRMMMETCVTVYWMRLCRQLLCLTGDPRYAEAIERSLYNAILGAIRPDGAFFEYFPRLNGARNPSVNYSFRFGGLDLSCCTANGPTGLCLAPRLACAGTPDGAAVNLYGNGEARVPFGEAEIALGMASDFPRAGQALLTVRSVTGRPHAPFALSLRVPSYARRFSVTGPDGAERSARPGSYLTLTGPVRAGDEWRIRFDIPLIRRPAPRGSNRAGDRFAAFTYGPLLLARDERDGTPPLAPIPDAGVASFAVGPPRDGGFLTLQATLTDGTSLTLRDYMSAGNGWDGGTFASWLPLA